MPRKYHHSRTAIHARESTGWDSLEPLARPLLTSGEIRQKRAELAVEMIELLLADGELAGRPRRTLEQVFASLGSVRRLL
jgi:hypothetical protein